MSANHRGGNIQNEITLEEHDGSNNAKRVNVVAGGVGQATVNIAGAATIYAVVNTSAPGVGNSIVTVANTPLSTQIVGNVTIDEGSKTQVIFNPGTLDSFGQLLTSEKNNQIDIPFYRATSPSSLVSVSLGGTGSANVTIGSALFSAGSNASASAIAQSEIGTVYRSGTEIYAFFTAAFSTPDSANSYQRIGLFNANDGFFIGYEGTTFKATSRINTVDTGTAKASWSIDDLTGAAGSKFTRNGTPEAINLANLNVFRIRFGWLGAAPIYYEVLSPDGEWVTFHKILYPNTSPTPSLDTADLTVRCDVVKNDAGATNVYVLTSCWAAGVNNNLSKINETITTETLAQLNRSVITGQTTSGGGGFINVKVTPSGALAVDATLSGNVTLNPSSAFIGIATVVQASSVRTITGNLTISDSKGFIGLVTAVGNFGNTGNTTLAPGPNQIGSVTVSNSPSLGAGVANIGFATVSVSNSVGNATLNPSPNYIGLVTVVQSSSIRSIAGNITLSDSKGFIGLTTTVVSSVPTVFVGTPTLYAVVNTGGFSGNVTLDAGSKTQIVGNLTLSDSKGFIGLATTVIGSAPTLYAVVNTSAAGQSSVVLDTGVNWIGIATVWQASTSRSILGNLTLSDSKGYIGLTTSTVGNTPTVFVGTPTLFAVVNTSAAGQASVVLDSSISSIGFATVNVVNLGRTISGNLTLSDSKTYIGLTTATIGSAPTLYAVVNTAAAGQSSVVLDTGNNWIGIATVWQASSARTITGNITLSDAKTGIGLVSVFGGSMGINAGANYVGLASVNIGGTLPALTASSAFIGIVTVTNRDRTITGNVTLSDAKTYIGLTTATLGASPAFVGIVTVTNRDITVTGNLTLSDSKAFIGLVTVVQGSSARTITGNLTILDAGTTKAPLTVPANIGNNSISTIVTPTNANRIKVTSMLLTSNITTSVVIRSGVTVLSGNASIAHTISPTGGFVLNGTVNSPSWIGLPSGALILEKRDSGGTVALVSGHVTYIDET